MIHFIGFTAICVWIVCEHKPASGPSLPLTIAAVLYVLALWFRLLPWELWPA